ncbi:MAG: hypothetical protein ABR551_02600 [Gemmatimonadales bacterium]
MASNIAQRGKPAWLLSSILMLGCGTLEPSEPALPPLAVRIEAPAVYQQWFAATASCSGLSGTSQTIEWYVVPGAASFRADGAERVGMWQQVGGTSQIVIAGAYAEHEMVVRHEILHHLLGEKGHPEKLFADQCPLTWERWQQHVSGTLANR